MSFQTFSLHQLGWRPELARHLTLADFEAAYPARVEAVYASQLVVLSSRGQALVTLPHPFSDDGIVVGDWVMIENDAERVHRVLGRPSKLVLVATVEPERAVVLDDAE